MVNFRYMNEVKCMESIVKRMIVIFFWWRRKGTSSKIILGSIVEYFKFNFVSKFIIWMFV